ncbi:hypothetical protein KAH37_04075, partial [bacterium]|nr:hypothetical protein [bacterium]
MDSRKKLLKLFGEIENFCKENGVAIDPRTYLLNKLYLQRINKRVSASLLKGITRDEYGLIGQKFEDRLKPPYLSTLSMSDITSLPHKKVVTIPIDNNNNQGKEFYLLSPALVLPQEMEESNNIHIGYIPAQEAVVSPFSNLVFSTFEKESPMKISYQATLFDVLNAPQSTIRPHSFHCVYDEIISSKIEQKSVWLDNLEQLLTTGGHCALFVKKSFLSSPGTKQLKQEIYNKFYVEKLDIFESFTQVHLHRKVSTQTETSTIIDNHKKGTSIKLSPTALSFNAMLTFDDSLSDEQLHLIKKIEEKSTGQCKEYFKFFIGMFSNRGKHPLISAIRTSKQFKPFIRSRDIEPFKKPHIKEHIFPDNDTFFQIPPRGQFEQKKLLLRYLSVKPVVTYDEASLYFLKDVVGLILLEEKMSYYFIEGYLNSKLLRFYYRIMFPHHNKFLKKNFNKLPFIEPTMFIQNIIGETV